MRFLHTLLLVMAAGTCCAQDAGPSTAADLSGFRTVGDALAALRARGIEEVRMKDGGLLFRETTATLWTFTAQGHYAHPSVVRRVIGSGPAGEAHVASAILCEASEDHCKRYEREVAAGNEFTEKLIERRRRIP